MSPFHRIFGNNCLFLTSRERTNQQKNTGFYLFSDKTRYFLAEKEGFEPSRPFRGLHDFQSCALDQLGDFSTNFITRRPDGQHLHYSRKFHKVKGPPKDFFPGESASPGKFHFISEITSSTALSTARPSFRMLRPTCVFMELRPDGIIAPATAPAMIPAPIPAIKPVLAFIRPPLSFPRHAPPG